MAIIQTIRDKYAKVAGGVIVLALVGFVAGDYFRGGGSRDTTIGKIEGTKIDALDFQQAVQAREQQMRQQNPNAPMDETNMAQIRDQVWNDMVTEKLMSKVYNKLGITVSKAEATDLVTGPNPDQAIVQAFGGETGIVNPQQVAAQITQIKKTPEGKAQWDAFEADIIKRRYSAKFNALIAGSVYTPKFILDETANDRGAMANVAYVKLPYTLINDNDVKVSDDELKKYVESHKAMYTIKQTVRSLDVVTFDLVPSAEDTAKTFADLERLKAEMASVTSDNMEAFINRNAQAKIPVNFFTKEQLQSLPNADELLSAPTGSIVGPFFDGANYAIAKIEDKKMLPDSVSCRHILVATQPTQEGVAPLDSVAAKNRIDSVFAMVNGGVSFDTLAARYSDDPGSKDKGGHYDFPLAARAQLAKEFGDFVFEGKAGEKKIVKTQLGYHYIEILKQGAPISTAKIAFVNKALSISDNTSNALNAKANAFLAEAKNGAAFDNAAKTHNYQITPVDGINQNSAMLGNIGASNDLVRWSYAAKMNDVSPIFTIGSSKFVIAKLSNIMEAGLAPINDKTRPFIEANVKRMKKAALLAEKVKGQTSLEAIAQSQNQTVATADSVNYVTGAPMLSSEPKVIGLTFSKTLKENTISPAITGFDGVYFISVKGRTTHPATERNIPMERQMANMQIKSSAASMVANSIREAADVKDMRYNVY
jgi:peptidyl-prolyl cis-trans isomerase D